MSIDEDLLKAQVRSLDIHGDHDQTAAEAFRFADAMLEVRQ